MTQNSIYFKQLELGPMANYVYLIGDPTTHKAAIIDPAWDLNKAIEVATKDGYEIVAGLVTHGHPDHVNAVEPLLNKNIPIYMHKNETPWFGAWKSQTIATQGGEDIPIGNLHVKCLHTPGHTPGSQCFLVHDNLLSGDTLFIGGCGRTDLPGGNAEELYTSLTKRMAHLPDQTLVFPGHNYAAEDHSDLGSERKHNPYMQHEGLADFIKHRQPWKEED